MKVQDIADTDKEIPGKETPTASTESLQQLSRQINGILAESPVGFEAEQCQSDIADLETRNRELAALLAQHSQANEQLNIQNEQIRQHALNVQSQLEQERSETQQRVNKELGPLKEQLQVHIQTIGILVAEKTELQSQLSQSHKIVEQRLGEVEDLTGRLKTSRQRVADLERSLSTSSNSSQKLEQIVFKSSLAVSKGTPAAYMVGYMGPACKKCRRAPVFSILKDGNMTKLFKAQEELKQTSSEVQEKLKSKTSECSGLQHSVDDLKRRLEMAELYSQQLSSQNESGMETLKVVEQLQQERDSLTTQVQQYAESFQRVSVEKDQLTEQFKQYMEQLQNQNSQLTSQLTLLTEDREKLVTQNHDMEAAVIELQRKLEDISSQGPVVDESIQEELKQEVLKLQTEYTDLSGRHEAQIRDNSQLSRLLEEKEGKLVELETRLEELGDLAGDKAELLENIQSDKTALSRALTQNRDLKQQLAELQNGFVKMSNDNMEMLTQLQTEQHSSRDLMTKLAQQEDELKEIREMLSQKDIELQSAQENSVESNKARLLHEQIQDRLRHYEAQAQLVETLQKELHSSQDMVDALTTQNSELRSMLIRATETKALNPDSNVENAQRENVIDSLQATIQQLEGERNKLMENLKKQREMSDTLSVKVSDLQEEVVQNNASNAENDKVSRSEYEKLKYASDMIQDKYNRVMRDKADLTDKADELEHLVLQLQGETDTIGEYISLYHHQRALLQQRELQKNDYIKQLAKDREELQDKLGELQTLVMQLMGEKNMLQSYHMESVRPVSPNIHPPVSSHKVHGKHDDWPDYTSSESDTESEVETIVGGKDDVHIHEDHEHVAMDSSPDTSEINLSTNSVTNHLDNAHVHLDSQTERVRTHSKSQEDKEEVTAHKILNLLTEIGHSNLVDSASFMEKQFHPCKYCKGRLQIL
ncbi:golgin subfamily A member 2-like [Mercenaria mercenaria]|uniref:golgin subfamily A member 2-like n=1 Tax=Mercenaria mercenaria TaxID=6596 RepID=UPI00234F3F1A|nr:golgin subfamily A member 2-like [Mercenaria mercenaria]